MTLQRFQKSLPAAALAVAGFTAASCPGGLDKPSHETATAERAAATAKPHVVVLATGGHDRRCRRFGGQQRHLHGGQGAGGQAAGRAAGAGRPGQCRRASRCSKSPPELYQRQPADAGQARCQRLAKQPDVDGIVITHGTDTLAETAYFLSLTVHTDKPIAVVGSMRRGTALSADGALNLLNAVSAAASKDAKGKGGADHHERPDPKRPRCRTRMLNIETRAFQSQWGLLGMVVEGRNRPGPPGCEAPHHRFWNSISTT